MSHGISRVGCIGAGVLGAAIMRRLIERGFAPQLWNRDRSKLAPLLKADATEATSPAELTPGEHVCDHLRERRCGD